MLDLIPAIDIKDGACVRLVQGDLDKNITVYSKDPRDMARHWAELGARRLHVVDLDGARCGRSVNHGVISDIIRDFSGVMEIDLGGGLRDLDTIESYMDAGLAYAVIGTAAIKQPGFLANACDAFPGAIIVSLDARNGKIATDGWEKTFNRLKRNIICKTISFKIRCRCIQSCIRHVESDFFSCDILRKRNRHSSRTRIHIQRQRIDMARLCSKHFSLINSLC